MQLHLFLDQVLNELPELTPEEGRHLIRYLRGHHSEFTEETTWLCRQNDSSLFLLRGSFLVTRSQSQSQSFLEPATTFYPQLYQKLVNLPIIRLGFHRANREGDIHFAYVFDAEKDLLFYSFRILNVTSPLEILLEQDPYAIEIGEVTFIPEPADIEIDDEDFIAVPRSPIQSKL